MRSREYQSSVSAWGDSICYPLKMTITAICIPIVLIVISSFAFAKEPKRIVSINLCADQYILALARKDQILALSPFAHNREMSYFAKKAKAFPKIRDDAESVLQLKPDLVIASVFNSTNTLKLIRRQNIKILTLGYETKLDDIAKNIRIAGEAIGNNDKLKLWENKFSIAKKQAQNIYSGLKYTALFYQRAGYISGKDSLTGKILEHVGLNNYASNLSKSAFGSLKLEKLLISPPDLLFLSKNNDKYEDQGNKLLNHPALLKIYQNKYMLNIPVSETVCGGPSTISMLNRLKNIRKKVIK